MQPAPWYRQGWPWFLIMLPGSVVIASFITLYIALTHDDSLVRDDYYKNGLAINRELAQTRHAVEHDIQASLAYDRGSRSLDLRLSGDFSATPTLELEIVHPTDAGRDHKLRLQRLDDSSYAGDTPFALEGRYYVLLHGIASSGESWRLRGTLEADSDQADLRAE